MTIKEFKDFLIERKYNKISDDEYSYIDANKYIIYIKIVNDYVLMRVDCNTDIGTVTSIDILNANIFDRLITLLKEHSTIIEDIKNNICIEESKEIKQ